MKVLIVGRTGRGKDYLAELLKNEFGWKFVKSYTTRAKRTPDEDTHIFISHEDAAKIPQEEKVAITILDNGGDKPDEYFATKEQVKTCDAYIIDPNGIDVLLDNMPDEIFEIVYLTVTDEEIVRNKIIERAKGNQKEIKKFESRNKSEDSEFTAFETSLENKSCFKPNFQTFLKLENDYSEDTMKNYAFRLNGRKHMWENLRIIIQDLKRIHMLKTDNENQILVVDNSNSIPYSDEQFIQLLLKDDTSLNICLSNWLSIPGVKTTSIFETKTTCDITFKEYIKNILDTKMADNPEQIPTVLEQITDHLNEDDEFFNIIDNYINMMIDETKETE